MKKIQEVESMFSEADYEALRARGATEDEIEILKDACAICDTADMVPDDTDKFIEKVQKLFPGKNVGKELVNFFALAEKDPKFFMQVISMFDMYDAYTEENSKVEKLSIKDINIQKSTEDNKEVVSAFKGIIDVMNNLSEEDKKVVSAYIKQNPIKK